MRSLAKLVVVMLLAVHSCIPAAAGEKPQSGAKLLEEATGIKVDPVAFRTQVRSLARPFSGILEGTADRILLAAATPGERIIALRIKVNAIPAIQGALFISDPLAAVFEVAGFLEQMRIYLAEGPGSSLPELVRGEATIAIGRMKERIRVLSEAHGVTPEVAARFWLRAERWAREHPVTESFVARETTQMVYAELIKSESAGLRGLARHLDENIMDLSLRFDLYAEYIAKQARWQAELMMEEGLVTGLPSRMVADLGPIPVAVPDLQVDLPAEREAVLLALAAERRILLDWGEAQRDQLEGFIRSERGAVSDLAKSERGIIIQELRGEREAVLQALDEQRGQLVADLDEIIVTSIERCGVRLIDHAALRLGQLAMVVLVLAFLASLVVVRYAKA